MSSLRCLRPLGHNRPIMSSTPFRPSLGLGFARQYQHELNGIVRSRYNSGFFPRPSSPNAVNMKILWGLIGINGAVFGYLQYTKIQSQQGFQKPLIQLVKNFTLNVHDVVGEGRWWQLLTACFTHFSPMHLLGNMLSAYYMGALIARTPGIGPGKFLTLVLGSGISGSAGYIFQKAQKSRAQGGIRGGIDRSRGLGFSGAVMGIGAAAACMYPSTTFMIYGIVPAPLWAIMGGYLVYDGFYLNAENSGTAHAGHLGGLAFGLVYYFARLRGLRL